MTLNKLGALAQIVATGFAIWLAYRTAMAGELRKAIWDFVIVACLILAAIVWYKAVTKKPGYSTFLQTNSEPQPLLREQRSRAQRLLGQKPDFSPGLVAYEGCWHLYHKTKDAKGEFWSYITLDFVPHTDLDDRLTATAVHVPEKPEGNWGSKEIDEYKNNNRYRYDAWLAGERQEHLVIQAIKIRGRSDMAIRVFPNPLPHLESPKAGAMIITHTWEETPAVTMTIISRTALTPSATPEWPIREANTMNLLASEWEKRCQPQFELLFSSKAPPRENKRRRS